MIKPIPGRSYEFFGDRFTVDSFDGEIVEICYEDSGDVEEMDIETWDEDIEDGCIEEVKLQ